MRAMNFQGHGLPLDAEGLAAAAETIGIRSPEIWTVLSVETRGAGFLADRRPLILFERHVFYDRSNGRDAAAHPNISNPRPGGYGRPGAHQFERLAEAIAVDPTAALESASWGIGQVMGYHAKDLGYADTAAMVAAMVADENSQLEAMARFIASWKKCRQALVTHDWPTFARCYNGPNYAAHKYDMRLHQQYQRWAIGPLPDLTLRAAQLLLSYRGFSPGPIDGVHGRFTCHALESFQEREGLTVTGELDAATYERLAA